MNILEAHILESGDFQSADKFKRTSAATMINRGKGLVHVVSRSFYDVTSARAASHGYRNQADTAPADIEQRGKMYAKPYTAVSRGSIRRIRILAIRIWNWAIRNKCKWRRSSHRFATVTINIERRELSNQFASHTILSLKLIIPSLFLSASFFFYFIALFLCYFTLCFPYCIFFFLNNAFWNKVEYY